MTDRVWVIVRSHAQHFHLSLYHGPSTDRLTDAYLSMKSPFGPVIEIFELKYPSLSLSEVRAAYSQDKAAGIRVVSPPRPKEERKEYASYETSWRGWTLNVMEGAKSALEHLQSLVKK